LSGVLTAFIGFIQRRLSLHQGVADWIGIGWRFPSYSGGGMNHIGVALSIIFGWRLASEYSQLDKETDNNENRKEIHLTLEERFSGNWRKYFQEEDTLIKIMDTAGLNNSHDFVRIHSRYLINDDRVAIIVVIKQKATDILDKMIIDVIAGFPSFEQFIDVIYDVGADCDYHVIICDKNSKNHTSLVIVTDPLMFQLMDHIDSDVFMSFILADAIKRENDVMEIHYENLKSVKKDPDSLGIPNRRDFESAELYAYCFNYRYMLSWDEADVRFDASWNTEVPIGSETEWTDDGIVIKMDIDNDDFAWLFTKRSDEIKNDCYIYDYDTQKSELTIKMNIPFRNFKYSSVRDKKNLADEFYSMANSGCYIEELLSEKEDEDAASNGV
jgi:hypothetical protein